MAAVVVRPSWAHRITRDLLSLGLYELWFRRTSYAVEDSGVVFARGLLVRDERRIPTSRISGVQVHLGSGSSSVAVDTCSGSYTIAPDISRRDARRLAGAIFASAGGRAVGTASSGRRRARLRVPLSPGAKLAAFAFGVGVALAVRRPRRSRRIGPVAEPPVVASPAGDGARRAEREHLQPVAPA